MTPMTPKPLKPCRLCAPDLPQATSHFDAALWEAERVTALERLEEALRDVTRAEAHLTMLAETED